MKKIYFVVFFLLCTNLAFADVSIIMKDGKILDWQTYFEENNSYCTWKSYGKFCVSQDDVKVVKETVDNSGQDSSGGSYVGNSGQGSSGNQNAGNSGQYTTIIQKSGSGVIVDENVSRADRDKEQFKLKQAEDIRRYEAEQRREKAIEDAKYREEQRKREYEERRYQQERERRIREEERKLYN